VLQGILKIPVQTPMLVILIREHGSVLFFRDGQGNFKFTMVMY